MESQRGRLIGGKYRVIGPLAEGGMGSVWRARHTELESEVALKLISSELAGSPSAADRFKREARAAARLKSVHVVQIHDYGVDDGQPYMVMELLEGEDLRQRMRRDGRVSLARALEIVRPLCKALEVAHAAGIVHRDIKPANIFLARSAQDEVVKVLDFGIAKEHVSALGAHETSSSTVLGSPMYMSPEQARASRVDHRSDLWSVAVVTFELLTGRQPFRGASLGDVFARICGDELPRPSELGVEHPGLDELFRKALDRDPDGRHASAADFAAALAVVARSSPQADALPPQDATLLAEGQQRRTPTPADDSGRRGRDTDTLALAATAPEGAVQGDSGKSTIAAPPRARVLIGVVAAITAALAATVLWRAGDRPVDPAAAASASVTEAATTSVATPSVDPAATALVPAAATASAAAPTASATVRPTARSTAVRDGGAPAARSAPSTAPASPPLPRVDPVFGVPVSKP
jgi:serine/threonine-protein kinase